MRRIKNKITWLPAHEVVIRLLKENPKSCLPTLAWMYAEGAIVPLNSIDSLITAFESASNKEGVKEEFGKGTIYLRKEEVVGILKGQKEYHLEGEKKQKKSNDKELSKNDKLAAIRYLGKIDVLVGLVEKDEIGSSHIESSDYVILLDGLLVRNPRYLVSLPQRKKASDKIVFRESKKEKKEGLKEIRKWIKDVRSIIM